MTYVDGFVCAVPDAKRDAYVKHAEEAARMFRDHGALRTVECWGDDVPDGKLTSFPMAVKKEPGESVIFSWIEWPSKEVRDAAWKKMMEDDRMKPEDMPFDGKRMIYGGFTAVLDA
jgi:uncharacterized protein YbaA (DUF1428 family)